MFESWAENLYDETFSDMFDALVAEYKNGEITVEQLKINLAEQQQILLALTGNATGVQGACKSFYFVYILSTFFTLKVSKWERG